MMFSLLLNADQWARFVEAVDNPRDNELLRLLSLEKRDTGKCPRCCQPKDNCYCCSEYSATE